MSDTDKPHYLAFVDGLRAISILAVVAFHVGVPGFHGGFIGVDVFFVISGFLIIGQIRAGLERGHFSLASFYARRSLRILPPFLVMLVVVNLIAPFVLPTPDVYFDFALAAVAAPLMISNILFLSRQGYFDLAADQKPLLHTWTLSVEEQFYFFAPLSLMLIFRLGGRRFGHAALVIAAIIFAWSFAGSITETSLAGRNHAFYLAHWRGWEFVAGGLIAGPAVAALGRAPRLFVEIVGAAGLLGIVAAVIVFDPQTAYPSYRAALPVAGAVLVILSGLAQPGIIAARLLALPAMVAIGLVSYGWYLWHWPILSFIRIVQLDEASPASLIAGAGAAFVLACASYRYLEQPIRLWRTRGGLTRPARLVAAAVAACFGIAVLGGFGSTAGYVATNSFVASRYGTEGQGVLDNGCRLLTSSSLPPHCLQGRLGVLLGDSHADAMSGALAQRFDQQGVRLISVARGGCSPILFAPAQRRQNRQHGCSNLLAPFEQLLALPAPLASVVIMSAWGNRELLTPGGLADLVSQFDARTHVLLIGPVPVFPLSSLDCVVLSDRYGGGRDRCDKPRAEVDADRAPIVRVLAAASSVIPNLRYVDPIDLFCDAQTCRPANGDKVYYRDAGHVTPAGAHHIYDRFETDFRWLTKG